MPSKLLLLAAACSVLVALLIFGAIGRGQRSVQRSDERVAQLERAVTATRGTPPIEDGLAREPHPSRSPATSAQADAIARVAPITPGVLSGQVTLDGLPPEPGGRVRVDCPTTGTSQWLPLDRDGRFRAEGVVGTLVLDFSVPPSSGRLWVLPSRTVTCLPGASTELALAWRARHVNLKVIGDLGGWNRAAVSLEGAGCAAALETDDAGRAQLALVAEGSYRLVARHPSGRTGGAELELGEEDDLESVVISLTGPAGG